MCLKILPAYTKRLGRWIEGQPGRKMRAWKVVGAQGRESPLGTPYHKGVRVRARGMLDYNWDYTPNSFLPSTCQYGGGIHVYLRRDQAVAAASREWYGKSQLNLKVIAVECHAADLIHAGVVMMQGQASATFREVKVLT